MGAEELNLDVDASVRARAIHRVIRAVHDGHCPECMFRAPPEQFNLTLDWRTPGGYKCPNCEFYITAEEATEGLLEFKPTFAKSVAEFKAWRAERAAKNRGS